MSMKRPLNLPIVLLIKYTILEQRSQKISQINFSFIQRLYVGDVSTLLTMFRVLGRSVCRGGLSGGASVEGLDVL